MRNLLQRLSIAVLACLFLCGCPDHYVERLIAVRLVGIDRNTALHQMLNAMAEIGYDPSLGWSRPLLEHATLAQVIAEGEACERNPDCREWNETRTRDTVGVRLGPGQGLEVQLNANDQRTSGHSVYLFVVAHDGDTLVVVYHGVAPDYSAESSAEIVRIKDHLARHFGPGVVLKTHGPAFDL